MSRSSFDSTPTDRLSQRGRRAVGLGALALVVIAAAGFAYLHSTPPVATKGAPPPSANPVLTTLIPATYDFVSPSVGWALETQPGQFRVYRTTDGAKHWQKQLDLGSSFAGSFPISIQFLDQDHGFVGVGDPFEQLNRTSDGGITWDSLLLPRTSMTLEGIAFTSTSDGWLLVGGQVPTLFATRDAGNTWRRLPDPPPDAGNISFRSPSEGWLGSGDMNHPHVYSSNDGGQKWYRHDLPPPPGRSWNDGIYFPFDIALTRGSGVVASIQPQFQPGAAPTFSYTSFDQGITWRYTPPPPGEVAYEDATHRWAMKGTSLFKSSDAGQTWTVVTDKLPDWQYVPYVLDSKHAWALLYVVGGYGLAVTNDGGLHWSRAAVPQS
jgi:photosystem II stability/assembly factor-like uncharacterized protein